MRAALGMWKTTALLTVLAIVGADDDIGSCRVLGQACGPTEKPCCEAYECGGQGTCMFPAGTFCTVPDRCCFGPPGTAWTTDLGVKISPVVGPCMGCWCETDSASFSTAVCEIGMSGPYAPPSGVDVCVGPVGSCMGMGVYSDDCNVLNLTKGAPVAGIPDPLMKLGSVWRRGA